MPARRHRRTGATVAAVIGLLIGSLFIWHATSAAFGGSTQNTGNSLRAGNVAITTDLAGSALFSITNLAPGASGMRCVDVTYSGTVPAVVRLGADYNAADPASALAPYLDFSIQEVDPAAAACGIAGSAGAGYIAASQTTLKAKIDTLKATPADLNWTPGGSGSVTKRYRFVYSLPGDNAAQSQTARVDFTWSAAST